MRPIKKKYKSTKESVKQFVVEAKIITQISASTREEAIERFIKEARIHLPLRIEVMKENN